MSGLNIPLNIGKNSKYEELWEIKTQYGLVVFHGKYLLSVSTGVIDDSNILSLILIYYVLNHTLAFNYSAEQEMIWFLFIMSINIENNVGIILHMFLNPPWSTNTLVYLFIFLHHQKCNRLQM